MRTIFILPVVVLAAGLLTSCEHNEYTAPLNYDPGTVKEAYAVIRPVSADGPRGEAWLVHEKRYLRLTISLENLPPDSSHGIQIDTLGGCEGRGPEAVYNPQGHFHAGPAAVIRRVGNLGNLTADAEGKAEFRISINNASLNGKEHAILGRSITINSQMDDLISDPYGSLGPIVACGVIGVTELPKPEPKQWYTRVEEKRETVVPESLLWYVPEATADDAAPKKMADSEAPESE